MNSKRFFIFIALWLIVSIVLLDETTGFEGDRRMRRRRLLRRRRVGGKANLISDVCIYIFCTTKCGRDAPSVSFTYQILHQRQVLSSF